MSETLTDSQAIHLHDLADQLEAAYRERRRLLDATWRVHPLCVQYVRRASRSLNVTEREFWERCGATVRDCPDPAGKLLPSAVADMLRSVANGAAATAPNRLDGVTWSPDFTTVTCGGRRFTFTSGQRAGIAKAIMESAAKGEASITTKRVKALVKSDASDFRVSKALGGHPALGTIFKREGKDSYRFDPTAAECREKTVERTDTGHPKHRQSVHGRSVEDSRRTRTRTRTPRAMAQS